MIIVGYNGISKSAEVFGRKSDGSDIDRNILVAHDAAAAVLVNGELVAAVEEERLSRVKKTSAFPAKSLQWCLDQAGVGFDEVDYFAFPWRFSEEVIQGLMQRAMQAGLPPEVLQALVEKYSTVISQLLCVEAIQRDFQQSTGYTLPPEKLVLVSHHRAHLMCGYFLAGCPDAAFLITDGQAEQFSSMMGEILQGRVTVFEDCSLESTHSIGILYSMVTRHLGFVPNNDEYKVMGLAAFGKPLERNPLMEQIIRLEPGGRYSFTLETDFLSPEPWEQALGELFGKDKATDDWEYKTRVARAMQETTEAVTAHQIQELAKRSKLPTLLLEGGVALNCVNNSKLLAGSSFKDVRVSFGASDPGIAIGAAVHVAAEKGEALKPTTSPYLGPDFAEEQIQAALKRCDGKVVWRRLDEAELLTETAKLLEDRVVLGWYQGKTEYGPRALGHRSILANPAFEEIQDIINLRVKKREPFRPFAPVVLQSLADQVFSMGKKNESPYMTFVFPVRPEFQDKIPGACHTDGTARIQTVTPEQNPKLARLLQIFHDKTRVPCLINTSFNVAGEPIVCTPEDALNCFLGTDIDYLVLGNHLVSKAKAAGQEPS